MSSLCQDQFEGRWSHTDNSAVPQLLPLTSVVSDRDMPFNTSCGQLSVVCYLVRILTGVALYLWCIYSFRWSTKPFEASFVFLFA